MPCMPKMTLAKVERLIEVILAADEPSTEAGGPCHFCNRPTTTDDTCMGCGQQVCEFCFGDVVGPHEAIAHAHRPGVEPA